MTAATFTLTGDLDSLVGSIVDRSVYAVASTDVDNPTDDISYVRASRTQSSGGVFSFTLPADAAVNLPHSSGGPQFYFTVKIGTRTWIVPAQAAGSTHDVTEFAAAVPVSPSTTDTTIIDNIVAGRIAAGGSATRGGVDGRVTSLGDARYAQTANRPVTLKDNTGIDFTGTTDSSTAYQAAITAAGAGTPIEHGRPGVVRLDSGVTLLQFQELDLGGSYLGAGGTAPGELRFTNIGSTGVGLTGGGNNVVRRGIIRGPMTGANSTVGYSSASGAPRFYNVGFYGWAIGTSLTNAYYSIFDGCEWSANKYGLVTSGCYRLDLVSPRFYCTYNTSSLGYGINGAARTLNVFGGSIEGYGPGGAVKMAASQKANLWGTYFESSSASSGAYGIVANALDKVTLNLRGCMVYLTESAVWLDATSATNMVLHSEGNTFVCPTGSSSAPTVYSFTAADAANIKGHIGQDDWSEVAKVGTVYTTSAVLALGQVANLDIRQPTRSYIGGDICGTGSPEGVVPGPIGAMYRRLDGSTSTSIYVKTSGTGSTGWTAK